MAQSRLTTRRLLGLDRSETPPQTLSGQPLRPLTLPNAVGFARLGLIPVFLVLALGSGDGRVASASIVYAVIGGSDYLDGLVARLTGQYSRLGAVLDPLVDRLLVLAGVAVTWRFELLPRWALGILAAREIAMLLLTQVALRRRREIEINWLGRVAVWPTMFSIFLAMVSVTWVAQAFLFLGIGMSLAATVQYVREGFRDLRPPSTST